jgi:lipopolysaccharide export system ATP-binding protein
MSNIKKFRIKSYKINSVILKVEKLSLSFEKKKILDKLDLELNHGQILGLLGPNGVGKSTLFNLIIGLLKPDSGSIFINSKKVNEFPIFIRAKQFRIGFVPQNGGFFDNLTTFENLKAIAEINYDDKAYIENKINYSIEKFNLQNIINMKAKFLSGGQKKKLVIAMALITNPRILMLDEPFAALDVMTIKMLQELVIDLQNNNSISIILCDHQARDLLNCVDVAAIIDNGKVIAQDTPSNLIQNINAQRAYFGNSFKIN